MSISIENIANEDDFNRVASNMFIKMQSIGNVDYASYYQELRDLQHPLDNVFEPSALAKDMASIQGYKDRAIEILGVLTENYLIHKRVTEILTKGWTKLSCEKSSEKREGEALLKLSNLIAALNDADAAYRYAMNVLKNLESKMDVVSRQIACLQAAAKISYPGTAFDNSNPFIQQMRSQQEHIEQIEEIDDEQDNITNWDQLPS